MPIFNRFLPLKGHLEFSGAFSLAEIFEKVGFDPYNLRITRLSARKSEQMKNAYIRDRLNTKIRLAMVRLSGFDLHSRWCPWIVSYV